MIFSRTLAIAALLLTVSSGNPLTPYLVNPLSGITDKRSILAKRDVAGDVCGVSSDGGPAADGTPASDTRTEDNWNKYDIDDALKKAYAPYYVTHWYRTWNAYEAKDDTKLFKSWQDLLFSISGPEGGEPCASLSGPCSANYDYNLCIKHPEVHFAMYATTHFANFLYYWKVAWDACDQFVSEKIGNMSQVFFRPRSQPSVKIMPLAITSGVLGAMTSIAGFGGKWGFFSGAAVPAGVSSILQGILTQDQLYRPDPIQEWAEASDKAVELWKGVITGLEKYWNYYLTEHLADVDDFNDNTHYMPHILKNGTFAQERTVNIFNEGTVAALATGPINSLWTADHAFVIKMTDDVFNQGKKACDAYPEVTHCENGVAYMLVQWRLTEGLIDQDKGAKPIDPNWWHVWGAYAAGRKVEDTENADHLKDYNLDLRTVVLSAEATQKAHGFLYKESGADVAKSFLDDPSKAMIADLVHFSIPVCDIADIVQNQFGYKKFDSKKQYSFIWQRTVACTCFIGRGWPGDEYKWNTNYKPSGSCDGWVK